MSFAPIELLVLEDNPGDLRLLQVQLAEAAQTDFRVRTAERLGEALKLLDGQRFDAVLTDLHLPDSNGLDTVRAVRRRAAGAAVVVLTGSHQEDLGREAINRGAQDYLVKTEAGGPLLARSLRCRLGGGGLATAAPERCRHGCIRAVFRHRRRLRRTDARSAG